MRERSIHGTIDEAEDKYWKHYGVREIVGAAEYLPNTVWMMMFLEHQGYKVRTSILYQDNEAAIKMEKNSYRSSSRKTRHFDIKYFLIKDFLKREKVDVVYCPTDAMVADFFTKPLQGRSLHKLRSIMGMDHTSILSLASAPVESRASKGECWRIYK